MSGARHRRVQCPHRKLLQRGNGSICLWAYKQSQCLALVQGRDGGLEGDKQSFLKLIAPANQNKYRIKTIGLAKTTPLYLITCVSLATNLSHVHRHGMSYSHKCTCGLINCVSHIKHNQSSQVVTQLSKLNEDLSLLQSFLSMTALSVRHSIDMLHG